jgi:hypothetical protein
MALFVWSIKKALALAPISFPRLPVPVKGTNMSTLLSTPNSFSIGTGRWPYPLATQI